MAKSTIFVDPACPQNLQTTIFIAPARPGNLHRGPGRRRQKYYFCNASGSWGRSGKPQNTIFVDPALPRTLQNTIFVDPAPPETLQNTISVDPTPPRNVQNTSFVDPAPLETLQNTIFVDPAPPGNLQNTISVNPAPPGSVQKSTPVIRACPGSLQITILAYLEPRRTSRTVPSSTQRLQTAMFLDAQPSHARQATILNDSAIPGYGFERLNDF